MKRKLLLLLIFAFWLVMMGRCLAEDDEMERKMNEVLNSIEKEKMIKLSEAEGEMIKEKCRKFMDAIEGCA